MVSGPHLAVFQVKGWQEVQDKDVATEIMPHSPDPNFSTQFTPMLPCIFCIFALSTYFLWPLTVIYTDKVITDRPRGPHRKR